mgnify:CR=1 FL=1
MADIEEQQKTAELMMTNILELGRFSYSLQEKREESLINQSGRMITAYSVTAALLPLLIAKTFNAGSILLLTSLLISFVFAVIAGWRFQNSAMPSIDVFFDEVYDRWEEFTAQPAFDMQWKYQLAALHKSKKRNNDKRANCILISMVSFVCSLIIAIFLIWG